MAGNLQADNSGNILCEFDYNNIIVVDPNRTIDAFGNIQERLVDHENLVMYANLEAELLPRTKLAVGVAPNDRIRTISVAKMNFLKPTKNSYLGTGYYDEITGENTTQFKGENQMMTSVSVPKDGSKPYVVDSPADLNNIMDNGLLGITQINIQTNTSFIPSVRIELEDVQGRALFQLGNNSPYAAFFNLPYPPFYLTLKGYYGQAIRYQLNLEKFNARFNSFSGNYQVSLEFKGYKFNILNEVAMGHLLALPHMYSQTFDVATSPVGAQTTSKTAEGQSKTQNISTANSSISDTNVVSQITSERGYQKIFEVYSEYKAKGLIPADLPELTLLQLMNKLETFEKNIENSFPKAEVEPLTNIRSYREILKNYFENVRGSGSWFSTYIDPKPLIKKDGQRVYTFKKLDLQVIDDANNKLKSIIENYNNTLSQNATLGKGKPDEIKNPIAYKNIVVSPTSFTDINWEETTKNQLGLPSVTKTQVDNVTLDYSNLIKPYFTFDKDGNIVEGRPLFFIFEGEGRFDKQITSLEAQANKKLSFYESEISAKLLKKIEDRATGIGFKPTVRNITAVVMASAEGFIRMLDDVHTNAWNVKYDPIRKSAILDNTSSAPNTEDQDHLVIAPFSDSQLKTAEIPVYPWPQFFVESPEDKKGRFQLKYIGDPSVVDLTKGYLYDKWPEVEFVEEYMKGITKKFDAPQAPEPLANERDTNTITINAIEFPSLGLAYANKEEIKFFYEIWERQFLTSHYSGLIRANANQVQDLFKLNVQSEVNNIYDAINVSAPYLSLKLKNYNINASNYVSFLEGISNNGTGRAYQDFIRDFFVTPYIKTMTENPTALLSLFDVGKIPQSNADSLALEKLIKNATNDKFVVDTIPFTNPTWVTSNMSNGVTSNGNDVYNTTKTLKIFEQRKAISNFTDIFDFSTNRPVTNFSYINYQNPTFELLDIESNQIGLKTFYEERKPTSFTTTEGYVYGTSPTSNMPYQTTTSLLNTPYFINAIQNGVYNNRRKSKYPYIQAAYIFLNSLPVASLREKYKSYNVSDDLDYIASCFNKFGAVHKLPYAWILKMGSVWHRYKKYKESGIDILSSAWSNFDYLTNYSPILSSTTQQYDFNYKQVNNSKIVETPESIVLQSINPNDIKINTGFYPKVINDFNYFYNSFDLYVDYNNTEIQKSVDLGMKVYNFPNSRIPNANQNDNNLTLNTWSITIPNFSDTPVTKDCNTKSNAIGTEHFIIPSFGCNINQTKYECFDNFYANTNLSVNLTNNNNMYNGSVRALWSSPNFGYFNSDEIVIPPTDSYLNEISADKSEQSPFKLLTKDSYSKIEEIFSVFEKRDLDSFENEFLNFSKAITDADSAQPDAQYNISTVNQNANFRNFQSLFKTMMTVPAPTSTQTDSEFFNSTINNQYTNVQTLLRNFLEYDIILRIGNPSKYKRRIFDSYLSYLSTDNVVDPIQFKPYIVGSLPTRTGNVTLQQSKTQNTAAWLTLETEVGFSTIPNVIYSSQGSYITDFFVENNIEFTSRNITLLAPLIKMYATAKLQSPGLTPAQFKNQLNGYLQQETNIQNNFINDVMAGVRVKLPDQQQLPERVITSAISGEQSKVENYEVFKALNDKWISGADFKNQTLFEDILFLDRASRNIGETILLDIFDLKNMFGIGSKQGEYSLNQAMSVFTFISGILIKNNFTVMNLPAYVNFYNVQDVDGTTIPQPEGSLEFANSMWGTFLDVDYRKSSSKMVCFYVGKPSSYLDLPKGNSRYRDDSFDLRRASENPLIENQQGKTDWALSNKCVGFNVDLGIRNQNVFYSFSVSQDNGVATSEAINTQINMVGQATGRNTATQNVGLYNLYKQRSYKATATCLGNALLQPTMYFNLRHVPMFNGPYMIMDVQHTVQPGNFQTTFTGVRQGIYDLPAIDSFLQSVNKNLLTRLEQLLKIKKDSPIVPATSNQQKSNNVVQKADNTPDSSNSCVSNVDVSVYREYTNTKANLTTVKAEEFSTALNEVYPGTEPKEQVLRASIYTISYISSYQQNSNNTGNGEFKGWNNNFGLISLYVNWNASEEYFSKTYCCVDVKDSSPNGKSQPLVSFANLKEYIKFMGARIDKNTDRILKEGLLKYYVCNWPKNDGVSTSYYESHIKDYATLEKTISNALSSAQSVNVLPKTSSDELKKTIEEKKKTTPTTQTTSPQTPTTQTPTTTEVLCLPQISSFTPASGNKGTIVQINGGNLDTEITVTINGVVIPKEKITSINSNTIRFTMPQLGNGITLIKDSFVLTNKDGSVTSSTKFTYNPAINTQTTSGVNINPQETGVNPLKPFITSTPNGGTSNLKVEVNQSAGAWEIESTVMMSYTINKKSIGANNSITETIIETKKDIPFTQYVSNDKQTFEITQAQVNAYLTTTVQETNLKNNKVYSQFVVVANALDKVKYPQPVKQSYNFVSVPSSTPPENDPGSLVKVGETDSGDLPNYNGTSYYNIKKPAGGYITFQFSCPNLITIKPAEVYEVPNLVRQNITITNNAGTKLTNLIEFSGVGEFQLSVRYTSDNFKWLNPNSNLIEFLPGGATSPKFTL